MKRLGNRHPVGLAVVFKKITMNNVIILDEKRSSSKYLLLSDVHWDNPKCDRKTLKRCLDEAVKLNAKILINGDLFCLMQGKYDPRRSKKDILPEHNKINYLDTIVDTAVEWFEPYAHHIAFIGYGNHETAVLKNTETDILARFVEKINERTKSEIQLGGYGGWIVIRCKSYCYRIKYMHGYGGGGAVTKGVIQHNRMSTYIIGADMIWMGHVHEDYEMVYTYESISKHHKVELKNIIMLRTSSFKEEYNDGKGGFHIEKGRPPKFIGGRWLQLNRTQVDDNDKFNAITYRTTV